MIRPWACRSARRDPSRRSRRHHAALRRALLDAAINFLQTHDPTTLTMQTLARAARVSPGAPYHHFADKTELLAALATECFEEWFKRGTEAITPSQTPLADLERLATAWLRFVDECPAHFRVMFLADVGDRKRFQTLHDTSDQSLVLLLGLVARGLPDAPEPEVTARAVTAWSTLHGFSSLKAAGVIANIPRLPQPRELEPALCRRVAASAFA